MAVRRNPSKMTQAEIQAIWLSYSSDESAAHRGPFTCLPLSKDLLGKLADDLVPGPFILLKFFPRFRPWGYVVAGTAIARALKTVKEIAALFPTDGLKIGITSNLVGRQIGYIEDQSSFERVR
jgi:hypothetical protein